METGNKNNESTSERTPQCRNYIASLAMQPAPATTRHWEVATLIYVTPKKLRSQLKFYADSLLMFR